MKVICSLLLLAPCLSALMISCCKYFLITVKLMICGVLKPSSGSIRLNGKSIEELGERYYSHLGYMPQDFGFYPDFTAREFMLYMAAVKGLDAKTAK